MAIRIGVLGLTHDHIWDILPDARSHDDVRLVAAADPHQSLLGRVEAEFGCRPYTSYETLLSSEELDAVFIYGDNAGGVELVEAAASSGLHVMIEKPLAASLKGADRIVKAVEDADVRMMANWPFAWWPQMQHALQLVADGAIGDVWQTRYRAAHAGPRELGCSEYFCDWLYDPKRNGAGGAFTDYCCYGAVLARAVMGMPSSVTAVAGRFVKDDIDVEDNGVLLMTYPHGVAVSEGSWTQIGKLSAYVTMIYGTTGTLMIEPGAEGRLFLATPTDDDGSEVKVPVVPTSRKCGVTHFVDLIQSGSEPLPFCQPDICRDSQAILEAGLRAANTGEAQQLP